MNRRELFTKGVRATAASALVAVGVSRHNGDATPDYDKKSKEYAQKEFLVSEKIYMAQHKPLSAMTEAEAVACIVVPYPTEFDNHEAHILEHRNFLEGKHFGYIASEDAGFRVLEQAMKEHQMLHSRMIASTS